MSRSAGLYLVAAPIEVTNAVTVRSVNGAEHTSLVGVGSYGASAVRCAFLTNCTLSGFALSGGYTHNVNGTDHEKNGGRRHASSVVSPSRTEMRAPATAAGPFSTP